MRGPLAMLLLWACALCACGPEQAAERGRTLYAEPRLSVSQANVFSCATCHATTSDEGGLRRPGHPLGGAAGRPSFWGGQVGYLLDAVNLCVVEFMRGDPLTPEDPQGLALLAYLRELPGPAEALPFTIVKSIDDGYLAALPAGDGSRGQAAYRAACGFCHGAARSGDGRLGPRVSVLPDDTLRSFPMQARAVTAEKARHGKFFGISGVMPPYALERLSDAELADILAYLLP